MIIGKWMKVHTKFHQRVEKEHHDMMESMLGISNRINKALLLDGSLQPDEYFGQNDHGDQINEREYNISKISDKMFDSYQSITLNEILYREDDQISNPDIIQNLYKTRFFIVGFQPLNLMEICQLFCQNCMGTFSFKQFMNV